MNSTDRFIFLGFPPRKGSKLQRFIDQTVCPDRTAVVYLPLRRLRGFLETVATVAPGTEVVVCRELTKIHEQFVRGQVESLLQELETIPEKGECTLLLHRSGD